jgi:hypothetical protein
MNSRIPIAVAYTNFVVTNTLLREMGVVVKVRPEVRPDGNVVQDDGSRDLELAEGQ